MASTGAAVLVTDAFDPNQLPMLGNIKRLLLRYLPNAPGICQQLSNQLLKLQGFIEKSIGAQCDRMGFIFMMVGENINPRCGKARSNVFNMRQTATIG